MTTLELSARQKEVTRLRELWGHLLGHDAPSPQQFAYWTKFHTVETITTAIERTAGKALHRPMDLDYKIRYVSRVCNDLTFAAYEKSKQVSVTSSAAS